MSSSIAGQPVAGGAQARRTVLLVFLACFGPFVLAYVAYATRFFEGRNNFGALIDPQRDVPSQMEATLLGGEPFRPADLKGKWILFQVASGRCEEACQQMMYYQRQIRSSTGKEAGRIERVVFLIDAEPVETMLLRQFDGVHFVRVKPEALREWLPLADGEGDPLVRLQSHVFVADPLGHVLMRFPQPPAGALESETVTKHWARVRKDISKLLWNSKIG